MGKIEEFLRLVEIDDEQDDEFYSDGELLDFAIDIIREIAQPKKCPFCGGSPAWMQSGEDWFIYCNECGISTPIGTEDEVLSVWNKRI